MSKFTNTDVLDQVDWENEIATDENATDKQKIKNVTDSTFIYTMAMQYLKRQLETNPETLMPNVVRMLQYFYGKFIYHHETYYGRDCDVRKTLFDADRREPNELGVMMKENPKLERSQLPLKLIKQVEGMFRKSVNEMHAEDRKNDGGYDEAKRLFEAEGIEVTRTLGGTSSGDRDIVHTKHDGVRYQLYLMKEDSERRKAAAKREAGDHKNAIERYHHIVKPVYEHLKSQKNLGHVWAMEGGGMQCQIFFGNKDGYLGILYLDMKSAKGLANGNYRLNVQWRNNNECFAGMKVEQVKVELSKDKR